MATKLDTEKQWYMSTVTETCAEFDVLPKKGLNNDQVRDRSSGTKKDALNTKLKTPKLPMVFWAALVVMLVLSATVFVLESNTAVFIFTFSACLLAIFGLAQQGFVRHIVLVVAKTPPSQVTLRREGKIIQVLSDSVVPGDVFILKQGDFVPVQLRLTEVKGLFIDETDSVGQNGPVPKNALTLHKKTKLEAQKNIIAAGSYVLSGTGIGIAVSAPQTSRPYVDIGLQKLNKKQQKRRSYILAGIFVLGLTTMFWDVFVLASVSLSVLLVLSANYYATYWLQYVTWASLYDQAALNGLRFKDFKRLKSFVKVDTILISLPSDFADIAAFVHQLQAELKVEVRPLIKSSDVKKLEAELNIQESSLTYKQFMSASRAQKIKQLSEYQLLVGFDAVSTAEAVSLLQQTGHHVAWIDDSATPQPASAIANTYVSQNTEQSVYLQQKSDVTYSRSVSAKKLATFFDTRNKFKNMTLY